MADRLAGLIEELGWASLTSNDKKTKEMNSKEVGSSQIKDTYKGITMLSHSKYTSFIINGLLFISKTILTQRFLYAHLDVKRTSQYRYSFLLCRSSYFLFMGGGSVSHSLSTMPSSSTPFLWLDVCYNFFYRQPATVSSSRPIERMNGAHNHDQGLELLMRYFVGCELGVSNVLQRHFCWTSNSLWFEEIPNATDQSKTFFCMGGKDIIVDTEVSDRSLSHAHNILLTFVACQTLSHILRC